MAFKALIIPPASAASSGMWRGNKSRRFPMVVGALAVLGAVLHAWVLPIHLTSLAVKSLQADGDRVAICHQRGATTIAGHGAEAGKPLSKKHCPVCSGLAALHFGVLGEGGIVLALREMQTTAVSAAVVTRVIDRSPVRILNRGPPFGI
jgi:hypothetical protein